MRSANLPQRRRRRRLLMISLVAASLVVSLYWSGVLLANSAVDVVVGVGNNLGQAAPPLNQNEDNSSNDTNKTIKTTTTTTTGPPSQRRLERLIGGLQTPQLHHPQHPSWLPHELPERKHAAVRSKIRKVPKQPALQAPPPPKPPKYEPGYPKQSRLHDFETKAVEAEVSKHDRLVVHGMMYMNDLTPEYLQQHWMLPPTNNHKLCLNIFACNRKIPYIMALFMSLLSGTTEPAKLLDYAQINLLNVNFSEMDAQERLLQHLPPTPTGPVKFKAQLLLDTIRAMRICLESGLPWCLIVEEDSIFAVDFALHLERFVIRPLELNETAKKQTSLISLYSYYNQVIRNPDDDQSTHRLVKPNYSRESYEADRSKLNSERKALGLAPYVPSFRVVEKEYPHGAVAMLYPRHTLQPLMDYLQQQLPDPEWDTDKYLNRADHYPNISGLPRRQVEPSLINHIGYYSERMLRKDRGMFSQLNTDVRFTFDAGCAREKVDYKEFRDGNGPLFGKCM